MVTLQSSIFPLVTNNGDSANLVISKLEVFYTIRKYLDFDYILIVDNTYKLVSKATVKEFLASDHTNMHKYIPENFDCDNFAFMLWSNATYKFGSIAIGVLIYRVSNSSFHAINFFITPNRTIKFIEPQADFIFSNLNGKPYFIII